MEFNNKTFYRKNKERENCTRRTTRKDGVRFGIGIGNFVACKNLSLEWDHTHILVHDETKLSVDPHISLKSLPNRSF